MLERRWGRPPSHGRSITHRTRTRRRILPLLVLPRPLRASCPRRGPIAHRICHVPASYPSCKNVVIPSREGFQLIIYFLGICSSIALKSSKPLLCRACVGFG